MKYAIILLLLISLMLSSCARNGKHPHFFQSWVSAEDQCVSMCNSYAQDYSEVLQYSMGTCICDNEEGRKVSKGYHLYLDDKCDRSDEGRYQ